MKSTKLSKKMSTFMKKDFNLVANLKYYIIAPIAILFIGVIVLCFCGFNLGLDFTGGSVMSVTFRQEVSQTEYKEKENIIVSTLKNHGIAKYTLQKQGDSSTPTVSVKFQDIKGVNMEELTDTLKEELATKLGFDNDQITNSGRIGASASAKLLTNALLAVGLATLLILVYIAIRFELFSGISAIIALVHDVMIMCALVAICRIQINSSFIAAVITVVGYSINNTIVIFDRVRENLRKESYHNYTNAQIVDVSVKDTLRRSLLTTLTTFLAIAMLAIIGVTDIREFVIPIIFGLLAGTYSSIFLAPSLWSLMYRKNKDKKLQKVKEKKAISQNQAQEEESVTEDVAN